MKKRHYVYHSYEEWGRDYIGCRSCDCLPEEDTKYFGSFRDKTFKPTGKTILFVCETRKEVVEIEIKLHDLFDVAVNPQFANRSKQTSTKFDTTSVSAGPLTEEHKKKISVAKTGKTHTEAQKKANSKRNSGEKNPMFGVPKTEAQKKAQSEKMSGENNQNYGKFGAAHDRSKAIIAIEPDGTESPFGSLIDAVREIGIPQSSLRYHLEIGHVLKCGKWKGWQFFFKNSESFSG